LNGVNSINFHNSIKVNNNNVHKRFKIHLSYYDILFVIKKTDLLPSEGALDDFLSYKTTT